MDISSAPEVWLDAQCGVLGSALISNELVPIVLAETSETDYSGNNRRIYQAMRAVFNDGIPADPVTIHAKLGGSLEDSKYIRDLMIVTPTAQNVYHYIDACKRQARMQQLRAIADRITKAEQFDDMKLLLDKANALLCERVGVKVVTMSQAVNDFIERHTADEPSYLTWPIPAMDQHIYAEKGDFIIFGGYPSTGKSAFALQCAWLWAQNKRVGFFSLETSAAKLFDRQVASVASIPLPAMKRNRMTQAQWDQFTAKIEIIEKGQLELVPAAGMSVSDVRAIAYARRYDIVIIDYLQLLSSQGNNRFDRTTNISLELHRFSQTSGCCVLALSQLRRADPQKDNEPTMSSLRESGQLEQDADTILLLYLSNPTDEDSNRILKCAKNKEGEQFHTELIFNGQTQTFTKAGNSSVARQMRQVGQRARQQNRRGQEQLTLLPMNTEIPPEFEEVRN